MPIEEKLGATSAVRVSVGTRRSRQPDDAPEPRWQARTTVALAVVAVVVRLFFWFYTQRTWEDGLITVQHAENAARGLGLTHDPGGVRVHGFTSALSVLIPLIGEWIHHGFGLSLLKLTSAICGGIAVWLGMRICQRLPLSFPITLLVGGYLAIEHQQILFGMAGMETQIAVVTLLLSIYSLFDSRYFLLGLSLGLCALARPDFGFWVVFVAALVVWQCWKDKNWKPLETVGLTLLFICGPWIAFTTWYYGSPLPNTILAKAWGFGHEHYAGLSSVWQRTRFMFAMLGPAYAGNGTGFAWFRFDPGGIISRIVMVLAAVGIVAAVRRKTLPSIAIAGFVVIYTFYYLFLVGVVALWYCIPLAGITILASGIGLDAMLEVLPSGRMRLIAGYAVVGSYLAAMVVIMPETFTGERNVQRLVEDGVRKQVGLYIAGVTRPDQTIGCEPLGYIGYYSRRVVFAYPGMCNLKVVRYVHEHPQGRNLIDMLDYFRPDYIALRPTEYKIALLKGNTWLVSDYEQVAYIRVPPEEKSQLLFPNDNLDSEFYVLKRISVFPTAH